MQRYKLSILLQICSFPKTSPTPPTLEEEASYTISKVTIYKLGGYGMHDLWMSEYDSREESWMTPVN